MEDKRKELLDLDKQRKELENEIESLTEFLTSDGMPGVSGSLLDNEGFPLPNIDHMAVRTARNKLIKTQNDLTNLMHTIESKMATYFSEINNKQKQPQSENEKSSNLADINEPIAIALTDDVSNNNKSHHSRPTKEPFAVVVEITPGSPAEESGLRTDDVITVFDNVLYKGQSMNPLQTLARICNDKINRNIPIEILRKNNEGLLEKLNLTLTPHTWNGRGILGCKLNLI